MSRTVVLHQTLRCSIVVYGSQVFFFWSLPLQDSSGFTPWPALLYNNYSIFYIRSVVFRSVGGPGQVLTVTGSVSVLPQNPVVTAAASVQLHFYFFSPLSSDLLSAPPPRPSPPLRTCLPFSAFLPDHVLSSPRESVCQFTDDFEWPRRKRSLPCRKPP